MILRKKKMNKLQRALLGLQEIESKQEKAIFSFAVKPIYEPLELKVYVLSHKKTRQIVICSFLCCVGTCNEHECDAFLTDLAFHFFHFNFFSFCEICS